MVSVEKEGVESLAPPESFAKSLQNTFFFSLFLSFIVLTTVLFLGGRYFFKRGPSGGRTLLPKSKEFFTQTTKEVKNKNPEKGYLGAAASIIENMTSKLNQTGWKGMVKVL